MIFLGNSERHLSNKHKEVLREHITQLKTQDNVFKTALQQTFVCPPANLGVSRLTAGPKAKQNTHTKCFTVNTFDKTH